MKAQEIREKSVGELQEQLLELLGELGAAGLERLGLPGQLGILGAQLARPQRHHRRHGAVAETEAEKHQQNPAIFHRNSP